MDLHVRNYILYKARTLNERKKELQRLQEKREQMRNDIIDSSPAFFDGQPRGKGQTGDPTQKKAMRLEELDKRIFMLDEELKSFLKAEDTIRLLGNLSWRIYQDTIRGQANLEYKAMEYGMCTRTLYNYRTKLMEILAKELGEYVDEEEL